MVLKLKQTDNLSFIYKRFALLPVQVYNLSKDNSITFIWLEWYYTYDDTRCLYRGRCKDFKNKQVFYNYLRGDK